MSVEEQNKTVLKRWYDEMWENYNFEDVMPKLAGPLYTRYESNGTRTMDQGDVHQIIT
jgi:hypothetical protein